MSKTKKDDSIPRKPSKFIYNFLVFIINILSKIFLKFKIKRDPKIKELKGPIVCLGTHLAVLDVAAMMLSMNKYRKLNIVVGRDVMTWSVFKPISKKLGLIPISQFGLDLSSVRTIMKSVKAGRSIALFPEGKISLDGQNLHYISPSLAKFLKMIGANIVFAHNYGGYCNNPKWASNFRKGNVTHDIKVLFTAEELKEKSVEEIDKVIQESFKFNESAYQQENNLRYKSKTTAKGLEFILYKCPKCMAEYENITDKKHIICKKCGNTVEYTEYGKFIPLGESVTFDRLDKWYDWQRVSIRKALEDENFKISSAVEWSKMNQKTNKYEKCGAGALSITYNDIQFEGKNLVGEDVLISYPLENQVAIIQKRKEGIDLTIENEINRFMFDEKKYASKYNLIVEEIFRKRHSLPPKGEEIN